MSPLKLSLIAGFVAVLLTLGGHHHFRQGRLQEASRLRSENDRMRLEASQRRQAQLAKADARGSVTGSGSPAGTRSSEVSAPGHEAVRSEPISRVPGTEYRNEGQTTPIAVMQSMAWACDHGDAGLMEKLVRYDEVARSKATAYLASLPPELRSQWATPEVMAAALLISDGMNRPYPVAAVIEHAKTEQIRPDRIVVHLPDTGRERSEYQKTSEGWRFAITEAMMDGYLRQNAQAKP